ncbi:MAG: hypothetical protein AABM42_12425 [Actinomycetota bacterium]
MRDRSAVRHGVALIALAAAIVAFVSPAAARAAFPGSNGRIAYIGVPSYATIHTDIFTVLPNGSGFEQLTDNGVSEYEPSWSSTGRRLTFIRGVAGTVGGYQVFKMNASGGNQTRVTHDDGIDSSPGFSPNGRRIAYAKDNLESADEDTPRRVSIFKIRPDGERKRRMVTGLVTAPEYSPNGERIVFSGIPKGKRHGGIWTIRPDGSDLSRLTAPYSNGYSDQSPSWSPDGRHIVFLRCHIDSSIHACSGDVYVMRANASHKHPIEPIYGSVSPTYSPAGDRIALSIHGEQCVDIYTINVWGSDPRLVTHNCDAAQGGTARQPSWQPVAGD